MIHVAALSKYFDYLILIAVLQSPKLSLPYISLALLESPSIPGGVG